MILSAVQFKPRLATCSADIRDNFRRCEPLIHMASQSGSELIVFPELFLTGYSFMSRDEAGRVCERENGPTFSAMRSVATDLKAHVAWGYIELGNDGKLYNSATIVDPSGTPIVQVRKINLWGNDFLWATPGSFSPPTAETELGTMSVIVCRDLRDKIPSNIPRIAARVEPSMFPTASTDIVAACVNWGKGGFPSTSWMDFASNNACTLVISNRWGEEKGERNFVQNFGHGGSAIVERDWTVHTNGLVFGADCVVTANLDT